MQLKITDTDLKKVFMKLLSKLSLSVFILLVFFSSCKKDHSTPATTTTGTDPSVVAAQGTWSVSSYIQKTEDKTSSLSGIVFTFSSDGSVSASNGGTIVTGTWSSSKGGITYYGGPPSVATFTINFVSDNNLIKISKTWNVASEDNISIKLDNKEPLEDEHLSLSKN